MKPTRVGATQSLVLNAIGYYIDQEPAPIIVALPTIDDATKFSTQLLQPMLDDTPVSPARSKPRRRAGSGARCCRRSFPGGTLQILGTKSPRAMRMVHGRIILMSEIDAYEFSAGTEGDPTKILPKRADGYGAPKFVRESSPLIDATSRIKPYFELGTMEYYHVPCPHCGELQVLSWGGRDVAFGLKWASGRPETVHYVCVSGCVIEEKLKYWMTAEANGAHWRATHPERVEHRSFQFNALISGFPGARWSLLVKEWLETKRKPELLKVFVNTVLGETFREEATRVEAHALDDRRDAPWAAACPAGVGKLVRTVDVQGDRLETLVVGFGDGEEVWPIEHELLEGDPGIPLGRPGSPWNELAAHLTRTYAHESGAQLAPAITGIDLGGHHSKEVYAFCRKYRAQRVYALQGSKMGQGVPLVSKQKYSDTGKTFFYSIGVFTAKELILARLAKVIDVGPGYIHIAEWIDHEQLEQLTAEELVSSLKGGRLTRVFRKTRDRNEFLDLLAYAYGMLHALGPAAVKNLGAAARRLMEEAAAAKAVAETASAARSTNPIRPRRRRR
jgi:phage terminase large subunit GpA-like protein